VEVAGVALRLGDVLLQRTPLSGAAVASDGAVTVLLDTLLSPELTSEGLAREFISLLQQARKAAELEVADRIVLRWDSADAQVQQSLAAFAAMISEDVLASTLVRDAALPGDAASGDLNGRSVRWMLAKA